MKITDKFLVMATDEFKKWLNLKELTRSIRFIQNYYTMMPTYARFNGKNHLQILKEIEMYQTFEHDYDEIAQNITMFSDAKIAICRDINKIPPGLNGSAQSSIHVEYILNPGDETHSIFDDLLDCNIWLNSILCMKFKINPISHLIINHPPVELVSAISIPNLMSESF